MDIQVAVLCDAATNYNEKLCILGAFDTIFAQQLPAAYPQCSIALRVAFSNVEEGAHKLRLNFVNDDGKLVMPGIDMQVDVMIPEGSHFATRNFVVSIQRLVFEKPGTYSIDVAVDGRQEASIPLLVKYSPAKS